jgi:hypothetical protein
MAKSRDAWSEGREPRLSPMRPPGANGISANKPRNENRRLKEKSEYRMHPVIPPRFSIARMVGDIMI